MADVRDNPEYGKWQPIETAPKGVEVILFFPARKTARGDMKYPEWLKIDRFPVTYPRQPTHWAPIPPSPEAK